MITQEEADELKSMMDGIIATQQIVTWSDMDVADALEKIDEATEIHAAAKSHAEEVKGTLYTQVIAFREKANSFVGR